MSVASVASGLTALAPVLLAVGGSAAVAGHLGARLAVRAGPVHQPGARDNHSVPTPSGGGLGVVAGVAAGLVVAALMRPDAASADGVGRLAALAPIALAVAGVGLLDDLYEWSPRLKFALLGAASVAAAYVAGPADELPLTAGTGLALGPWAALAGSTLWVFTVKNAVNFMDGANGLAGGAVAIASAALAVIAAGSGAPHAALAAAALAGALGGFLPLNTPQARVFMGDVGSLFIGLWYAAAGLLFALEAPRGAIYAPPLLLLPMLADTLLTLAWHVRHRAPLMRPHRDHAYQVRIARGESHAAVALSTARRAVLLAVLAALGMGTLWIAGEPLGPLAALIAGAAASSWWWMRDRRS